MELSYSGPFLRRTGTHIYILPHPLLRDVVAHYTLCLAGGAPAEEGSTLSLLPDASGCLVFTLTESGLDALLFGPSTRLITVENDLGRCPLRFFIEFLPGALYSLTGIPQWELADRVLPLDAVAPELEAAVRRSFETSAELSGFLSAVDVLLLNHPRWDNPATPLLRALERKESLSGSGWSPRHLSRLLRQGAGMGAKGFLRVVRVNQAVRLLSAGPCCLTRLSQDMGYYDQSHFIHDFSSVVGLSPTAYLSKMADFYKEPLKL